MTHVDAYSLERARFGGTMLQFPSAAMHLTHLADVIATTRSKETPAEKHDKKRRSVKLPPSARDSRRLRLRLPSRTAASTSEEHRRASTRFARPSIRHQRFEALEQMKMKLERVLAAVPIDHPCHRQRHRQAHALHRPR